MLHGGPQGLPGLWGPRKSPAQSPGRARGALGAGLGDDALQQAHHALLQLQALHLQDVLLVQHAPHLPARLLHGAAQPALLLQHGLQQPQLLPLQVAALHLALLHGPLVRPGGDSAGGREAARSGAGGQGPACPSPTTPADEREPEVPGAQPPAQGSSSTRVGGRRQRGLQRRTHRDPTTQAACMQALAVWG